MLRRVLLFIVLTGLVSSVSVFAQSVTVPKSTVIPVSATSQLSSAVSNKGDSFTAVSTGAQGCSFPAGTTFTGKVMRVIRGSGKTPGQIAVEFHQAQLPDGTCVKIKGSLTTIDQNIRCTATGAQCLTANSASRGARNEFIAGDNCTVFVGVLCRGNVIIGEAINIASMCPPNGTIKAAGGQDVVVGCGTTFGIMLDEAACIQGSCSTVPIACPSGQSCPAVRPCPAAQACTKTQACPAGPACPKMQTCPSAQACRAVQVCPTAQPAATGAGPASYAISFASVQPFDANGALMVPLQTVMDATGTKYMLDPKSNMLSFTSSKGMVTHKVGSNIINVNGQNAQLKAFSGTLGNVIYVPSDAIQVATGRTVAWDADKSMLSIK